MAAWEQADVDLQIKIVIQIRPLFNPKITKLVQKSYKILSEFVKFNLSPRKLSSLSTYVKRMWSL